MHTRVVKALSLSKKQALTSIVGAILAASLVAAIIYYGVPSLQENRTLPSNSVAFAGTISFQFEGSNISELTTPAGSAVQGTVLMNISQAAPLLIYVADSGTDINQTTPTLPPGISVSLEMYGNSYNVPSVYEVAFNDTTGLPLSTVQLVPTTLGETSIQYTINVASSVPAGVYNVKILFVSMLKGDMLPAGYPYDYRYGYGDYYTVILHVQ